MTRDARACLALFFALAFTAPSAVFGFTLSFSKTSIKTSSVPVHADLNNDGREDFVFLNLNGGFDVQLSSGDGAYASPASYTIPGGADAGLIGIADFNSDGTPDLAVFGSDHALHLFLNNGHGGFSQKATFSSGKFSEVSSLVVADFNRDGAMDLAARVSTGITIVFGNGKSGFSVGPTISTSNEGPLLLGDFDGDSNADIAISDIDNYDTLEVHYGNGKGSFPMQSLLQTSGDHFTFSAADVNGDGKMDIIATQFYTSAHTVSVFYGSASRTWTKSTTIPLVHCAGQSAIATDINGDGINDLIVAEADCNDNSQQGKAYVGVITGKGNAGFNADQIIYTGVFFLDNFTAVKAERNTKPDITFQNCTKNPCASSGNTDQEILLNTTPGNFPSCAPPNAFEGINICSPAAGATVTSPVAFAVGAAGQVVMRKVEVWADGKKLLEQLNGFSHYTFLNHSLSLAKGNHNMTIFAAGWDNSLQEKKFTLHVK